MRHDVKDFFGIEKEFRNAEFLETDSYRHLFDETISAIKEGYLISLTGIVGSGKTVTARRIRQELKKSNEVIVSTSLTVEKQKVKLGTLIYALFADLLTDKKATIPSKLEFRERELVKLIKKKQKPVVLFIDEAHDLHHKTLTSLKRLQEIGQEANSLLSVVLVGHPRLCNDMCRPSMEEIGGRVVNIPIEGIRGNEDQYISWILHQCLKKEVQPTDIVNQEALDMMAQKFSTPLQINHYMWIAFVRAFMIGQKQVTTETLEEVIAKDLNSVEANLKRHGYDIPTLSSTIDVKPTEIRSFLNGHLSTGRTQEIENQILKLGLTES